MIEVERLQKKYGELVAVDGVSFTAEPGKIFGLLGPNGAGKSTTIGCISGLLTPTSGTIRVLGQDLSLDGRAVKRQMGVVPQELALYEDLSAAENLMFWGGAYGLSRSELKVRVPEVLSAIGLLDRAKEAVKRYSGGMKRRLNLGCGIIHRPKVLLLDEPTAGVDPQSRVYLLDLVRTEVGRGTCVLYTTHYMEEAEDLCDMLAVIDRGKIIAHGTLAELRARGAKATCWCSPGSSTRLPLARRCAGSTASRSPPPRKAFCGWPSAAPREGCPTCLPPWRPRGPKSARRRSRSPTSRACSSGSRARSSESNA